MKNQKSILLSIVCLLLLSLAACQTAPGPTLTTGTPDSSKVSPTATAKATRVPSPTPVPTSAIRVEPEDLEGVNVRFWHAFPEEAGEALADLAQEFNDSNEWGIQVKAAYQGGYDNLSAQVRLAIEEGEPPEAVAAYLHQALYWEMPAMDPGTKTPEPQIESLLVNLNEYVNDPEWGLDSTAQEDFYPVFWQPEESGERRVGLPALRYAQVLYYNQTWAKALGFREPPSSPSGLERQACAAAQANRADEDPGNDTTGGLIVTTHPSAILAWIEAYGGEVAGPDGYKLDTSETRRALTFLRGLYDQGCAWIPITEPSETEFANRQGLFMAGSVADIAAQARTFQRLKNRDQWTVVPFPSSDGEPAIGAYGPSYVIFQSEPERQLAAWLFLRWLSEPEAQARLSEASGLLPTRRSALEHLDEAAQELPQWGAALALVEYARPEPSFRSWSTVRWAISDAATQLFRYYFNIDQVPQLVKLLDDTANDLHQR